MLTGLVLVVLGGVRALGARAAAAARRARERGRRPAARRAVAGARGGRRPPTRRSREPPTGRARSRPGCAVRRGGVADRSERADDPDGAAAELEKLASGRRARRRSRASPTRGRSPSPLRAAPSPLGASPSPTEGWRRADPSAEAGPRARAGAGLTGADGAGGRDGSRARRATVAPPYDERPAGRGRARPPRTKAAGRYRRIAVPTSSSTRPVWEPGTTTPGERRSAPGARRSRAPRPPTTTIRGRAEQEPDEGRL